jgi:nucleoid-associated protein YgaU
MWKFLLHICIFFFLLAGCASQPREELQLARRALAQAYAANASELAPTEYQAAATALRDAENLMRYGNYKLARKVLPQAATHGFRATFKAREERVKLDLKKKELEEKRRREEEEKKARLAAIEAARKKAAYVYKKKAKRVQPARKAPLLTHFEVREKQSLWTISGMKEVYNDPLLWPAIYKANRDQIKDPRQVYPGQVLTIPRQLSESTKEITRQEAKESGAFSTVPPANALHIN